MCWVTRPNQSINSRGSVLVFAMIMTLILATLLAVIIDIATVAWHQRQLSAITDATALAGAQGLDKQVLYTRGAGDVIPLDSDLVRTLGYQYLLAARAPQRFAEFSADITSDNQSVLVRTSAKLTPPLRGSLTGPIRLHASALATTPIR
jgi:Flp pilus assembly protein TadG